jgi:hypothetical protein
MDQVRPLMREQRSHDCASLDWPTGPHPTPSGSGLAPTADRSKTPAAGSRSRGIDSTGPVTEARIIRNLRHPDARWVRIPIGLLCIIAGFFSFLPVLGLWMLPLGLLLLAYDVPFLRKPVGYFTIWSAEKWVAFRQWLARKRGT